jgi:hypothetical protein
MKYAFILFISSLITASGNRQVVFHRGDLEYVQKGDRFKPVLHEDEIAKKKYKSLVITPDREKKTPQNVTNDQISRPPTTSYSGILNKPNDSDERLHEVKKKHKSSRKKSKKKKDKGNKDSLETEKKSVRSKSRKKSKKNKSKSRR